MARSGTRVFRAMAYALGASALLLAIGALYQAVGSAMDRRAFPPPGRLVDVDGGRLHIHCTGAGEPAVVLDAGGAESSSTWMRVQAELAEVTRTCSFDRNALGWSDALDRPHTIDHHVDTQETLLRRAGVEGPYILVGHSLGGSNAQLFASRWPEQVVGLVLVDAPHPDIFERVPEPRGAEQRFITAMRVASRLGIVRLLLALDLVEPLPASADPSPRQRAVLEAEFARPGKWDVAFEMNARLAESLEIARRAGSVPDVPAVVVSRGVPDTFTGPEARRNERVWQDLQARLAEEFLDGRHVIAEGSGHMIPLEQPGVVGAVRDVLESVRRERRR